jgi:hypothetical protein
MAQLLDSLPPELRLARYRDFAEASLRQAAITTDPGIRADFLSMAAGWHLLIAELERTQGQAGFVEEMSHPRKAPARN